MKKHLYKILVLIKRVLLFPRRAKNYYLSGKQLDKNIQFRINVALLMAFQYNDEFVRKDVIIRYMALKEKFNGKDNKGLQMYHKLMSERYIDKPYKNKIEESLDALYISMRDNGFDDNYPIPLSSGFQLLDGSHRLASALIHKIEEVPISVLSTNKKIHFDTQLLKRYKFSEEDLILIKETEEKLFFEMGVYFPIIIWPPAFKFAEEIKNEISYDLKYSFDLSLNRNNFEKFVRAIYAIDHIAKWKVEKKLEAMTSTSDQNKVKVLFVDFKSPNYRKKKENQALLSLDGETLKQQIRSKYKSKVENYIYDIIVHTGDNFMHNKTIVEITKSYLNE